MAYSEEELDQLKRIKAANPENKLVRREIAIDSRREDAPLHHRFTWDDTLAGEKLRDIEAGEIIRTVQPILIETPNRPPVMFVPYVRDPDAAPDEQSYVSTVEIFNSEDRSLRRLEADLKFVEGNLNRAYAMAMGSGHMDVYIAFLTRMLNQAKGRGSGATSRRSKRLKKRRTGMNCFVEEESTGRVS